MTITDFEAWISSPYYSSDESNASARMCMDIETADDYSYKCFNLAVNNCTVSFTEPEQGSGYYYGDTDLSITLSPVKLSSEVCKVENGTSLFATAYQHQTENFFYFTDASGKKTISMQGLENGHIVNGELVDYTPRELGKFIIFPDITFGGVLPGMTAEKFWDIIATESEDDDDDDDDWGYPVDYGYDY